MELGGLLKYHICHVQVLLFWQGHSGKKKDNQLESIMRGTANFIAGPVAMKKGKASVGILIGSLNPDLSLKWQSHQFSLRFI